MSDKPKVVAEVHRLFRVSIKGSRAEGLSIIKFDDGLVSRFVDFLVEEEISSPVRSGSYGPGSYSGYFYEPEADKILGWLKAQGGVEIDGIYTEYAPKGEEGDEDEHCSESDPRPDAGR